MASGVAHARVAHALRKHKHKHTQKMSACRCPNCVKRSGDAGSARAHPSLAQKEQHHQSKADAHRFTFDTAVDRAAYPDLYFFVFKDASGETRAAWQWQTLARAQEKFAARPTAALRAKLDEYAGVLVRAFEGAEPGAADQRCTRDDAAPPALKLKLKKTVSPEAAAAADAERAAAQARWAASAHRLETVVAAMEAGTACAACGDPATPGAPLRACSLCGAAFYCGAKCQQSHWTAAHKRACARSLTPPPVDNERRGAGGTGGA